MDDHTEIAVAADVIVALVDANVLPGPAATAAGAKIGIDHDDLAAAVDRLHRRVNRPRSFNRLRYIYDASERFEPSPRPFPQTPRPPASPGTRANSPAPARPRTTVDPIAERVDAVRNGFYLPTGEHVSYLQATAAQHLARADWLHSAAVLAEAAAVFHETAAAAITATSWAVCLADLPEANRPALPPASEGVAV